MTTPTEMTAIAIEGGRGPAEALHPVKMATPRPRAGEILIRVEAAGVNRPDLIQRMGMYPPPPGAPETLGLEVAGTVAALGENAPRWAVGDKVCALLGGGGYAQYAVVDARHALPIPVLAAGGEMSMVEAAALPETIFTVYANVFEHGGLKAGETFMVHGATSGIGVAAIQMAKAAGAKVIATGRGADKAAMAKQLGADVAVDAKAEDFAEVAKANGGVDVILDMVGGDYFAKNIDSLKTGGRLVQIAAQAGGTVQLEIFRLMQKRATVTGSTLRPRDADEKARLAAEVERVVWPWVEAGKLKQPIDARFPLAEAAKAHAHLENGGHVGKVMLTARGSGRQPRRADTRLVVAIAAAAAVIVVVAVVMRVVATDGVADHGPADAADHGPADAMGEQTAGQSAGAGAIGGVAALRTGKRRGGRAQPGHQGQGDEGFGKVHRDLHAAEAAVILHNVPIRIWLTSPQNSLR